MNKNIEVFAILQCFYFTIYDAHLNFHNLYECELNAIPEPIKANSQIRDYLFSNCRTCVDLEGVYRIWESWCFRPTTFLHFRLAPHIPNFTFPTRVCSQSALFAMCAQLLCLASFRVSVHLSLTLPFKSSLRPAMAYLEAAVNSSISW